MGCVSSSSTTTSTVTPTETNNHNIIANVLSKQLTLSERSTKIDFTNSSKDSKERSQQEPSITKSSSFRIFTGPKPKYKTNETLDNHDNKPLISNIESLLSESLPSSLKSFSNSIIVLNQFWSTNIHK